MNSGTGTGTDTGTGPAAGRVLVVDDEKPLARMVATYLERAGYEVALTHTGPAAVQAARVGAVMRRPRTTVSAPEPERVCGDLVIDLAAHEARVSGQVVQLTRTEFDLLAALSGRPHQAFSRRQLIDIVWDPAWVGDERLVDVHIKNLRRKLDADPARYIDTVRGVGYRMAEQ